MIKNKFTLSPYTTSKKSILIMEDLTKECRDYGRLLTINIDYDDVDHEVIDKKVQKLLDILNAHW